MGEKIVLLSPELIAEMVVTGRRIPAETIEVIEGVDSDAKLEGSFYGYAGRGYFGMLFSNPGWLDTGYLTDAITVKYKKYAREWSSVYFEELIDELIRAAQDVTSAHEWGTGVIGAERDLEAARGVLLREINDLIFKNEILEGKK